MTEKDEEADAQASLDSFSSEKVEIIEGASLVKTITGSHEMEPLRRIEMPSQRSAGQPGPPPAEVIYHDLLRRYPAAPVAEKQNGLVLHRGVLQDLTGVDQILDWLADGEVVIVEMGRLMQRAVEFESALARLHDFIEGDIKGQIVQLTTSRLLLLPPGCKGVRGVEDEAFAAGPLD